MKKFVLISLVLLQAFVCKADDLVLSNAKAKLVFASDSQAFLMKSFEMGGKELLHSSGSSTPVWDITFLGPHGESPNMKPRFTYYDGGAYSADSTSVTFTWRIVMDREPVWPLKVTVSLPEDAELPEWSISMDMPEGWVVTNLEFPRLSVARPENVKGIMSVGFGAEYPIPNGDMIQSRYPSCTGALQLVLAHNQEGTFFFSSRDKGASMKYLQIKGEGSWLTFVQKLDASYSWTENGHFELPWKTVLGYNPETWEETVTKWYTPFTYETAWGEKTLADRHVAEWIQNADIWLRPQDTTEKQMTAVRKALSYYGEGVGLHWYYWHNHPFDSYYPEYFPAKENFADCVAEAQSMGAFVTPYINGRLWDSSTDSYIDHHGYEASCRKRDGSLYTEIYSSKVINTVTCPASEIWKNELFSVNNQILQELGTNGVYMDQIGAAASEACYAPNHGHALGGGDWWPKAYREMLTEMRDSLYEAEHAMTTEENAECYIDLFDMMLVVNGPHTPTVHMVPLFPLVYSDRCVYSGFTYIPWRITDGSFLFITAKSLLWGSQLGWINPEILFSGAAGREVAFLKTLGDFRKDQHDLFLGGHFLREFVPTGDNPEIDVPSYQRTNVVMGSEWLSIDGQKAALLVNMSSEDHTVTVPDGRTVTVKALSATRL